MSRLFKLNEKTVKRLARNRRIGVEKRILFGRMIPEGLAVLVEL
jgi:hypothetical protein